MLQPKPTIGDSSWFVRDRFGMFIHWGLYALPARHEWVRHNEQISEEDYRRYFEHFDPDLYDPKAWARTAREAGMKYAVITTKHHEGFCLWDSKYTDYKATNTPYGKDLLRPWVEAFRAEGLKIGFYYSLIDWHHPDFPIDRIHAQRNHPDALQWNETRDVTRYAAYMRDQVRELLTEFGEVSVLWFDFSYGPLTDEQIAKDTGIRRGNESIFKRGKGRDDWESEKLLALVRELQPKVLVDNRLDLPDMPTDFVTPEQYQPQEWQRDKDGEPLVWETCQTFSGSWGYHREESTWKSPEQLVQMLINSVACGGNLLMNVGPTARGTFDPRAVNALGVYRDWMALHARSIYGCTQADFTAPRGCTYTQSADGRRLYVHLYAWPFKHLYLPGLAGRVEYAQLLNDASEVKWSEPGGSRPWDSEDPGTGNVLLHLPVQKPDVVVPVIELFLK